MQHIFNIAIDMDDERIKEAVAAKAEKEIMATITREVGRVIFERSGYYSSYGNNKGYNENHLGAWAQGVFEDFLKKHKDAIIKAAAKELADRLARTKAGKAILENLEG
jgi:hypothetical protein